MADIINNNIYGGAIIPSSFVFDFVHYGSYKTLMDNNDWETMTIGRHCLIKYCNYAFTTEERIVIERGGKGQGTDGKWFYMIGNSNYEGVLVDEHSDAYRKAFDEDNSDIDIITARRSYDGLIIQKTKDGPLMIGYTNHGLSTEYADSQFATDFQDALDRIDVATGNLGLAVTAVNDLSNEIGSPSDDLEEKTIYGKINNIEQNISKTNEQVGSNSTKITTLEEKVSSVEKTINEDLKEHIVDFNSRTTWDEEKGVTLSLGTELPEEDTPGRLTVIGDNIYYNKQILSRDSWFNEAETAGAQYGAFPQVQVEEIENLKNIPVKIYIGSKPPVSTENDITIWIKTK